MLHVERHSPTYMCLCHTYVGILSSCLVDRGSSREESRLKGVKNISFLKCHCWFISFSHYVFLVYFSHRDSFKWPPVFLGDLYSMNSVDLSTDLLSASCRLPKEVKLWLYG